MYMSEEGKTIDDLKLEDTSDELRKAMSFVVGSSLPVPEGWSEDEIEELEFPKDLTKLSLEELGSLMSKWSSVIGYAEYVVAQADIEKSARNAEYNDEKKDKKMGLWKSDGVSKKEARLVLDTDPSLRKKKLKKYYAEAKYKLVESLLKSYKNYYRSLSRELSRREAPTDYPGAENRASRAGNKEKEKVVKEGRERSRSLFKNTEGEGDD